MRRVNVTTLSIAGLFSLLQQVQSSISTSQSVDASSFLDAILVAAEAQLAGGGVSSAVKDQILNLLDAATQSQATLSTGIVSTVLSIVQRLSANVTTSQAGTMLSVLETVTNRSTSLTQQTGSLVLSVLESAQTSKRVPMPMALHIRTSNTL
jgi:hypothetical protein